jgi:hypothetical protein
MTSVEAYTWRERSRRVGDPAVRYHVSSFRKGIERWLHGVPDDHPALHQFVAEVRFLEEQREERRLRRAA